VAKPLPKQPTSAQPNKLYSIFLLIIAALLLYAGWRAFWFITDDAYIAFRYVSNSIHGHGYVWNPAPFRPVEGYTSFLWVVILDFVWRVFRVEPPDAANVLSLMFSFGTVAVTAFAAYKSCLSPQLERSRLFFAILVVAGLLVNPTFLTWASSGLETALFNFCLLCWVVTALIIDHKSNKWLLAITATAALTYLARPDGILVVIGTLLLVARNLFDDMKTKNLSIRRLISLSPILLPFIHLSWRKSFYGEWLPNTYYAKQVAAWPSAGIRYLLSFIIEYGLWFWIIVMVVALVRSIQIARKGEKNKAKTGDSSKAQLGGIKTWNSVVVVGVVLLHFGYYTFVVGGDHFEWRVYSQLFPLLFLSLLWVIRKLDLSPLRGALVVIIAIVLSLPIPWSYHSTEQTVTYVPMANNYKPTVSDKLPFLIAPLAQVQDSLQSWLTDHLICVRRQKHKLFFENQIRRYHDRNFDVPARCGKFPVGKFSTVGVVGWMLPTVNILDGYGLNDYIVARTPVPESKERRMAHDRLSPPKYFASFVPNVWIGENKQVGYLARRADLELTDDKIKAIEEYWDDKLVKKTDPPDSLAPWPVKPGSDTTSLFQ
jgi:arabinofuranosyltransferase